MAEPLTNWPTRSPRIFSRAATGTRIANAAFPSTTKDSPQAAERTCVLPRTRVQDGLQLESLAGRGRLQYLHFVPQPMQLCVAPGDACLQCLQPCFERSRYAFTVSGNRRQCLHSGCKNPGMLVALLCSDFQRFAFVVGLAGVLEPQGGRPAIR